MMPMLVCILLGRLAARPLSDSRLNSRAAQSSDQQRMCYVVSWENCSDADAVMCIHHDRGAARPPSELRVTARAAQ